MRRLALSLTLMTGVLAASAVVPAFAGAARLVEVGTFSQPIYVAAPPGDFGRLMVVEKGGSIQVLQNGSASLFLDVGAAVGGIETAEEQGLLSMAFSPDYATSGRFYVYYTAADGMSNRVDEFRVSADPRQADPATRRQVISLRHTRSDRHNGGQVAFGPDGLLYVAPGDGGHDPDPATNPAQDTASLLGKVLRIDPLASGPNCPATPTDCYRIPPDNPFVGPDSADEVYHLGLRNPFRFSFDRQTGDLMIGDVGSNAREEVTLVAAGTAAGRNFGWPICEGSGCDGAPPANYLGPALEYSQASLRAVTGGVVVRDLMLPELLGRYIYADFYEGVIRSTTLTAGAAAGHGTPIGLTVESLAAFSEDNGNCVYIASLVGGRVYRLAASEGPAPVPCSAGSGSGSGSGTSPGPEAAAPVDLAGPVLKTHIRRRQRVLRHRGAIAYTRCDEPCTVAAGGKLRIGRRSFRLRRASQAAETGQRARIKVRLTPRARRALRRALRRGRRASVRIGLRARDAAGNRSRLARARVRVRG
jgi:glucose/arabinose dehydrogenase